MFPHFVFSRNSQTTEMKRSGNNVLFTGGKRN